MPKKKKTMACGELAMVKASDGRAAAEWNSAFIGDWGISPTSSAESRMAIQGHCLPLLSRIRDNNGYTESWIIPKPCFPPAFLPIPVKRFGITFSPFLAACSTFP